MVMDDPNSPVGRSGRTWQVPTFLLGLGALLGVLFFRPLWRSPEERLFEKQLEEVRTALARSEAEWKRALALEEPLRAAADQYPQRSGEVYYLLGSTYLLLSDGASADAKSELL